ncbi:MAG TPA: alpha/beta fold hydrolase [Gaiellaceae bacterium]|nr:alpha/beta fold hydrolase [Gaiellaceae bacterium]
MTAAPVSLASGAEARITGPPSGLAVVCVNGGQGRDVPGTWSATLEWLVERLAPDFPGLGFAEVRYRVKSWNRLGMCVEDAVAALEHAAAAGARRALVLGFSMGGAVAIRAAAHRSVEAVVGLAPWIPDRLDLSGLDGRRLAVFHGAWDRYLPGIPGVSPAGSRRGFERARARGVEGSYELIPRALHPVAVRAPWGGALPLPRAGRWAELVAAELRRFQASDASG